MKLRTDHWSIDQLLKYLDKLGQRVSFVIKSKEIACVSGYSKALIITPYAKPDCCCQVVTRKITLPILNKILMSEYVFTIKEVRERVHHSSVIETLI